MALAQVPRDTARDNTDVAAIARTAANPDDLETLDAYCATGSLRRAADLLHLHHSSVARRHEQIGKTLGIELTEPTGVIRARLALTAWRLLVGWGRSASSHTPQRPLLVRPLRAPASLDLYRVHPPWLR